MRKKRIPPTKIVLLYICVMYAITYMDRVNVSTSASVFQKELHLSNAQVGLVFSAFAYPYLAFQLIGGWVSDRFGARLTLIISESSGPWLPWQLALRLAWGQCSLRVSCWDLEKALLFPLQHVL